MIGLVTAPETPNGLRLGAVCCLADASYSPAPLERGDAVNDRACRADSEKRRRSRILDSLRPSGVYQTLEHFLSGAAYPVLRFGIRKGANSPCTRPRGPGDG